MPPVHELRFYAIAVETASEAEARGFMPEPVEVSAEEVDNALVSDRKLKKKQLGRLKGER